MIPYVYLIGWKILDTWYCGAEYKKKAHPQNLWTSYFTSSYPVAEFRKLHGDPDHIEILKEFEKPDDALEYEDQKLIEYDAVRKPNWLNQCRKGKYFSHHRPHSEQSKRKMSEKAKGRIVSNETRKKLSSASSGENNARFGVSLSQETKQKISNANKGKILTEEHKRKISENSKHYSPSLEHREKLSKLKKGVARSEELKRKISESWKNRGPVSTETGDKISKALTGKKRKPFSEETKRKMSESSKSRTGKKRGPYKKKVIDLT